MKLHNYLQADFLSGALTVLLVAGLDLWLLASSGIDSGWTRVAQVSLYAGFLGLFFIASSNLLQRSQAWIRWFSLGAQFAIVCAIFYLSPVTFTAILLVIWSAQLPHFVPFRLALLSSPLWSAVPWLFHIAAWQSGTWLVINALLFFTFNLFALIMMESRKSADLARADAEQANREIRAMQSLLQQASKQDERLRIARDIHDVVGHHLTALTVQLQVLARQVDATHRPDVERSHAIARLLLGDVRVAVSDIREQAQIDLTQALNALVDNLPGVDVVLKLPPELSTGSVDNALTLLRCVQESVTNSIRHGKATHIEIEIEQLPHQLVLTIEDRGLGTATLCFGNGLNGMQERIAALGGELDVRTQHTGVKTRVTLPLREPTAYE